MATPQRDELPSAPRKPHLRRVPARDSGYLTVDQAARKAGVHHNTIRRLLRLNQIAGAHHVGRAWRIPADFHERLAKSEIHA